MSSDPKLHFDADQPRAPAGEADGGQWVSSGGDGGSRGEKANPKGGQGNDFEGVDAHGKEWSGALSKPQRDALSYYTYKGNVGFNAYLRGRTPADVPEEILAKAKAGIAAIDSALATSELPSAVTVFRGFSGSTLPDDLSTLVGKTVSDKAYVSTSLHPGNSEDFSDNGMQVFAEIRLPKGYNAAYVAAVSKFPGEKEVLIPRGRSFRVVGFQTAADSPHEVPTLIMEPVTRAKGHAYNPDEPRAPAGSPDGGQWTSDGGGGGASDKVDPIFDESTSRGQIFKNRSGNLQAIEGARQALSAMSDKTVDALKETGTKIELVKSLVASGNPNLRGSPRGWPPGSTWDNVTAVYDPGLRTAYVGAEYKDWNGNIKTTPGTAASFLHEAGHAYDLTTFPSGNEPGVRSWSETKFFKDAYTKDVASIDALLDPTGDRAALAYFLQPGNAGIQEAFAESFIYANGLSRSEADGFRPLSFRHYFRHTIAAVKDAIA